MVFKITEKLWNASGKSVGRINGDLNWIIGYIAPNNKNRFLLTELTLQNLLIKIEIDDNTCKEISKKFDYIDDTLINVLLTIAFAIGGQE